LISPLRSNNLRSPSLLRDNMAFAQCKTLIKSTYSLRKMKDANQPKSSRKWAAKKMRHFQPQPPTTFEIFLEKRSRKIVDRPLIDYSNLSGRKKMKKNKQQSSIFHNYQKHLIVGLKNMLKPELYCFPNHLQHVANDLWSIFLNNFR
jgi:hypothetical protein